MIKVKICCIASEHEAQMAIEAGADALGLVGPMPSGPGPIPIEKASELVRYINKRVATFYLTCKTHFNDIQSEYELVKSTHLQLTDATNFYTRKALRRTYPNLKIVQVVHVIDQFSIAEALESSFGSDFLLLDSGASNNPVKELGGTGRTHNWHISKEIVKEVNVPVFLAGGLNPSNISDAVSLVQPYGVDVCSGIRSEQSLDRKKLYDFILKTHH